MPCEVRKLTQYSHSGKSEHQHCGNIGCVQKKGKRCSQSTQKQPWYQIFCLVNKFGLQAGLSARAESLRSDHFQIYYSAAFWRGQDWAANAWQSFASLQFSQKPYMIYMYYTLCNFKKSKNKINLQRESNNDNRYDAVQKISRTHLFHCMCMSHFLYH